MACLRFPAGSLLPFSGADPAADGVLIEIDAGKPAAESGGKPSALQNAPSAPPKNCHGMFPPEIVQ